MPDPIVLCYHAISPSWDAALSVTPAAFARQIAFVIEHGWTPVTFAQASRGAAGPRTVAITFDDAFASVRRYAVSVLERYGAPATVFAPTSCLDSGSPLAWDGTAHWLQTPHAAELEPMSWDDLRGLAGDGWEIGSHTVSHPHLTRLEPAQLAEELAVSRQIVQERIGRPCDTIAYPYGDAGAREFIAAQAAGYSAAAMLGRSLRWQRPHEVPRVGIYHGDDWRRFRLKLSAPVRLARTTRWPARGTS